MVNTTNRLDLSNEIQYGHRYAINSRIIFNHFRIVLTSVGNCINTNESKNMLKSNITKQIIKHDNL